MFEVVQKWLDKLFKVLMGMGVISAFALVVFRIIHGMV